MIRRTPKRTRITDWLVCIVIGLLGVLGLALAVFGKLHGTTPEDELVTATGIAKDAEVRTVTGRYDATTDFLKFTVEGYRVSFASDQDGFDRVLDAVRSGREMTIGVSTKRETILPRKGWVPLYTLQIGQDRILSYETTINEGHRGGNAAFVVGAVLLLSASLGLYRCFANRNLPAV